MHFWQMLFFIKMKLLYCLTRRSFKIIFNIFSKKIDMHYISTFFGKTYDCDSDANQLSLTQRVATSIPKNRTIYNKKHGKYLKLHLSVQQSLKYLLLSTNAK